MEIENRTPHPVVLLRADGVRETLPPTVPAIRLLVEPGRAEPEQLGRMRIYGRAAIAGISNLPPIREGVILLVSQLTAIAINAFHPERTDVFHPANRPGQGAIRNREGFVPIRGLVRAN